MEPGSSKLGAESAARHNADKPEFMTVGDGVSENAAKLTSMINDTFHDSGYGGSITDGQALSPPWESALAQDFYTPALGEQTSKSA